MFPVSPQRACAYAHLFAPIADSMILSCLHGVMGQLVVDSPRAAQCGYIHLGDFCFIGGNVHSPAAQKLLQHLPISQERTVLWVPCQKPWIQPLLACWHAGVTMHMRYAMQPPSAFDCTRLAAFVANCPLGYTCVPMDIALTRQALSMSWSEDLCGNFADADAFVRCGLGAGVLYHGQLVSGATSYSIYHGGIEIEIDTHPNHRQRGLARACGAALILSCLARGLTPCWDAANLASVQLARQLGYRFLYSYPAFTPVHMEGER